MVLEVTGPSRSRSQCAPLGEVPPFGFSEREEPRPFEARVCHRGQYRPVAFQSTFGRDARGHLTPRPLCDRGVPSVPGGEQAAQDPACATFRGVGPGVGSSARGALREGSGRAVLGDTTCSNFLQKRTNVYTWEHSVYT